MKTEINIQDYLSQDEIKDIVIDEVRNNIKAYFKNEQNAERLLSNLSYAIVYDEIDKVIPNSRDLVISKTQKLLNDIKSYQVFRYHYNSNTPESIGAKIVENCVMENKDLMNQMVKDTILNKDYSSKIWDKFEELAESFISNIYSIVELGRNKNKP